MRISVLWRGRTVFHEGNMPQPSASAPREPYGWGKTRKPALRVGMQGGQRTAARQAQKRRQAEGTAPPACDHMTRPGDRALPTSRCGRAARRQLGRRAHVPPRKVPARICDDPMRRNECARFLHGCTGTRVSESMADSPAGKAGVEAEDGSPREAGLPGGHGGFRRHPGTGTIAKDRPVSRFAGGSRRARGAADACLPESRVALCPFT